MSVDRRVSLPATRPAILSRMLGPGAVEFAVLALSLATGPILSRALGEADRGSLAAVLVPTQLLAWLLPLGVPYGSAMLLRDHDRRTLVASSWRIALVIGVPVCVACYLIAPHLLGGHPAVTIEWFRIGLIASLVGIPAATALNIVLVTGGASWRVSLGRSLHLVLNTVAVVTLALAGRLTLTTALAGWIGSYLVARALLLVVLDARPVRAVAWSVARAQVAMGRSQTMVSIGVAMLGRIDQVFLAVLAEPRELGSYTVAATAVQASLPVAKALADVVLPDAFDDPDGGVSPEAIRLVFGASCAIGALSAVSAPWLIPALFGSDFSDAVRLLWLLIPGQVLFNTAWVISAHRLGGGRGSSAARAIGIAALANVAVNGPVIAAFGPAGAAVATTVCQGIYFFLARRH